MVDASPSINSMLGSFYRDFLDLQGSQWQLQMDRLMAESVQHLSFAKSTSCSSTSSQERGAVFPILDEIKNMSTQDIMEIYNRLNEVKLKPSRQDHIEDLLAKQVVEQGKKITQMKMGVQCQFEQQSLPKNWEFNYTDRNKRINSINRADLDTLSSVRDLNGTIINFYLAVLNNDLVSQTMRESSYFYNTYFMSMLIGDVLGNHSLMEKLCQANPNALSQRTSQNYYMVRRWTKKVNIFEKKMIVIPINMPHHWTVIIVYNLPALSLKADQSDRPMILYFDSLQKKNKQVVESVRQYLRLEAVTQMNQMRMESGGIIIDENTLPCYQLMVPRQTNFHDCGLYMLLNVQSILLNPQVLGRDLSEPQNQQFLHLFPQSLAFAFRYRLRDFLVRLQRNNDLQSRQSVIDQYLESRERLLEGSVGDDYDRINGARFRNYLEYVQKIPRTKAEQVDYKLSFYLKTQINYYQTNDAQ